MECYQRSLNAGNAPRAAAEAAIGEAAGQVIGALDGLLALPPALPRELGPAAYEWLALMPGFGKAASAKEEFARLYREKVAKGLL